MDEFDKFYNKTLKFLSYRPRSEKEIRDYLNRKKAESSITEKIIKSLKEFNFLNDEEFARWWIEQRTAFKPRSLRVIKMELKQKGISDEIINNVIQNSELRIQNDLKMAKEIVQKKIYKYKGLTRQEVFKKLGAFLARRGFSYDIIKQSIDESLIKIV